MKNLFTGLAEIFFGLALVFALGFGLWLYYTQEVGRANALETGFKVQKVIYVWIDPETKCEYVGGVTQSALTPRLNREGKQICR